MKRTLIISSITILGIIGIYFLWKFNDSPPLQAWDLVLEEALIVFENNKNGPNATLVRNMFPDSIHKELLKSKDLLISVHLVGKEEFGTVLYLPASPELQQKMATAFKTRQVSKERLFEGYKITEIPVKSKRLLSAIVVDGIMVISNSSFLIEDVIRLTKSREDRNFISSNKALFQFAKTQADGSNVYINITPFAELNGLFFSVKDHRLIPDHLARSLVTDTKWQNQTLQMSGFAIDSISKGISTLSLFNQQKPVALNLQRIISNRTGLLAHYGITDFTSWNTKRLELNKAALSDSLNELKRKYGWDTPGFFKTLGEELGACHAGIFSGEIFIV